MTRNDFKKGQTVYLLRQIDVRKNSSLEENIIECEVVSVGRKYITVNYWNDIQFDITRDFRQKTIYNPSFSLWLSKEEIYRYFERRSKKTKIERAFRWDGGFLNCMTDEEIDQILEIIERYEKKGAVTDGEDKG